MATQLENFDGIYKAYASLFNASLLGAAVIVGSIIEGSLSHLEVRWDKAREKEYNVRENWFSYLALQCATEPVGFRYISRMFTTMYFELSMMVAAPIALVGVAVLAYEHLPSHRCLAAISFVALAAAAVWFLFREAKNTHEVLCEARKEINGRFQAGR